MSRSSSTNTKVVSNKAELVEWFRSNCTPAENLLIGLEHEKPPFYLNNNAPVPHSGERPGIRELFQRMAAKGGWEPGFERDNIVELRKGDLNWTLEPGGQMETGGAPFKSVHQNAEETDRVIAEAVDAAKDLDIGLLALGYHPTHNSSTLPTMPRARFSYMRSSAESRTPVKGANIWWCTSTVQVNLGYESEEDMVKKLRVAVSLQPVVAALYANSPFRDGKPSGYQSYRSHVLHSYMPDRCGTMLPVAFEKDFGFERFVDYAMNEVKMFGAYIDGVFTPANGGTFADFMEGRLSICPGRKATFADWENHLNTLWPEVRLRRFLEMRGADSGPPEMIKALPAFWVGILYDKQALDAAYEMVQNWTDEDRDYLRMMTPRLGLQTKFMYGATTVQELAKNCLAIAEGGLKRRNLRDEAGHDESFYLAPLHEIAKSGKNWAQRLVERFRTAWKGDIGKVFEEHSYDKNPTVLGAPRKSWLRRAFGS